MPQFDTRYFFSQIFWAIFCFGWIWSLIHFWVMPRLRKIYTERSDLVQDVQTRAVAVENKAKEIICSENNRLEDMRQDHAQRLDTIKRQNAQSLEGAVKTMQQNYEQHVKTVQDHFNQQAESLREEILDQVPALVESCLKQYDADYVRPKVGEES